MQTLYAMEENASHPMAIALVAAAESENARVPKDWSIQNHQIVEGQGVRATVNGTDVYVGNMRLFERLGMLHRVPNEELDILRQWTENGFTVGFLSIGSAGIVGSYCVADKIRAEASEVLEKVRRMNIEPIMLTGDNHKAAMYIGKSVGLQAKHIKSQLLPQEKLQYVESVISKSYDTSKESCLSFGQREDLIMMCGDGVNDAPALALANVGVAMGAGAAIAMESADVTLLDSDLRKLVKLLELSKGVTRKIIENVTFSLFVKLLVFILTFTGYASLWAAIGSDVGAMLLVTTNSMRLLPSDKKDTYRNGNGKQESSDIEEHVSLLE